MKNLRKFLSLFLILPIMFIFSACKDNNKGGGNDGDGGNTPQEERPLTAKEIMKLAFSTFDEKSKKVVENKDNFAAKKNGSYVYSQYNDYVYAGISVLSALADVEFTTPNAWCYGKQITTNGETNYANKVSKIFLSSFVNAGLSNVMCRMQLTLDGLDIKENPESFVNYYMSIVYSEETKNISFDIMIEKSKNVEIGGSKNSISNCYTISYDSNQIVVSSFTRNFDIDIEEDVEINSGSISNYNALRMNIDIAEVIYEKNGFDNEKDIQADIKNKLFSFKTLANAVAAPNAIFELEGVTEKVAPILNAQKISDFEIEE